MHHEILTFVDGERGIEVSEQLAAHETNYAHAAVSSVADLNRFLHHVGFPAHALIVRPRREEAKNGIHKGLQTYAELEGVGPSPVTS